KNFLIIGILFCGLAVIFGAFGAHSLNDKIPDQSITSFKTGVQYQFLHGLALIMLSFCSYLFKEKLKAIGNLFAVGTLLFSGSIYLLTTHSITGIGTSILGPLTPIGGSLLIIAWFLWLWKAVKWKN
ncbi:UNVERIFIED_CONTAM: hypothetical protein GTU68_025742, partial [Idotea baltica]|nr:hypothetical protein [Idotea baltica]